MDEAKIERMKWFLIERGETGALCDAFNLCLETGDHETSRRIRAAANERARGGDSEAGELYWKTVLFDAVTDFDCFMRYLERNRPVEQQFWLPRRNLLMPVCQALQSMEDGKLDELFLSLPPRVGKSTITMMFILWVMGRDSERSNLYCSFTDKAVDPFYNGLIEVLGDPVTYTYGDIFPAAKVVSTNAKDDILNLGRRKRYASFTGRPIGGTLNGACDCNGYLIGDDLCSGIEEAMSRERLASLWALVDNNLLPRAKESAKRLWIGTRWSLFDPQGVRMEMLLNDERFARIRWKSINTPALNGNDESNFEYLYGVGFSTGHFLERRASFERRGDMASWLAQFQGEPIERDGAVFSPEDLHSYNGVLPEGEPDRVFMAVDPAWGGGDYVAAPVVAQYGDDLYIPDVVYSNGEKNVTEPLIVRMIEKYNVAAVKVEGTKMTASYGEDIDAMLRAQGRRVNLTIDTKHFTGTGKRQRIFDKAPDIREHMYFLQEGMRSRAYSQFMQSVYSFTVTGKQAKHDDAPDSLAMAINMAFFGEVKAEYVRSPFRR